MATIHYLNVKEGDCSAIQHDSGRVSVIDVCNAKSPELDDSKLEMMLAKARTSISGNFQQKKYPVNPIAYLQEHGVSDIFRYIQTHPDMDHMDGVKALFSEFSPLNFWDTNNQKQMSDDSWATSPFERSDWEFYKSLRDSHPTSDPRRLALLARASGEYYNSQGGDGLYILAPTQELVDAANISGDYNNCSYVLLFLTGNHRIIFGGDSHDDTWEYICSEFADAIKDIDLLIAPHHGRSSGRSYAFLDLLRPSLTFFGNAPSENLAYDAWRYRELPYITNNQANCMVVDASQSPMNLYVTNKSFAERVNAFTRYSEVFKAWFVGPIERLALSSR